jgi:hypothetical protein
VPRCSLTSLGSSPGHSIVTSRFDVGNLQGPLTRRPDQARSSRPWLFFFPSSFRCTVPVALMFLAQLAISHHISPSKHQLSISACKHQFTSETQEGSLCMHAKKLPRDCSVHTTGDVSTHVILPPPSVSSLPLFEKSTDQAALFSTTQPPNTKYQVKRQTSLNAATTGQPAHDTQNRCFFPLCDVGMTICRVYIQG